jgi:HlyD family secretion protein
MKAAGRPFVWILAVAAVALLGAVVLRDRVALVPGSAEPTAASVDAAPPAPEAVAALGRLQPRDGVIRVAGPSLAAVVVSRLLVDKGDRVEKGQVIALLDETAIREAAVAQVRAELANAKAELVRNEKLHQDEVISDSLRDQLRLRVAVARAELRRAEAELERCRVRAPFAGQVLEVHARDGERVGPDGILELGRTHEMYAVAEVYESDIGRVHLAQRASVTSPALPRPLHGAVDRIGLEVGKLDALGTDPAARTDARVVEVEIRLDPEDVPLAAPLTHLQVEVELEP